MPVSVATSTRRIGDLDGDRLDDLFGEIVRANFPPEGSVPAVCPPGRRPRIEPAAPPAPAPLRRGLILLVVLALAAVELVATAEAKHPPLTGYPYCYVNGNPVNLSDPTGHAPEWLEASWWKSKGTTVARTVSRWAKTSYAIQRASIAVGARTLSKAVTLGVALVRATGRATELDRPDRALKAAAAGGAAYVEHNRDHIIDAGMALIEAGAGGGSMLLGAAGVAYCGSRGLITGGADDSAGSCIAGSTTMAVGGAGALWDGSGRFGDAIAKIESPPGAGPGGSGGVSRGERLQEFFGRLDNGPAPANADDALNHIGKTLDEVEDELSGIPRNPKPSLKPDGRMYPPQADNIVRHPDGSITARNRGHITEIGSNGSITIKTPDGRIVYSRNGGG